MRLFLDYLKTKKYGIFIMLGFGIFYAVIYKITAKAYYSIVARRSGN